MVIAWLWFRENVDGRLIFGAIAILAGAVIVSWEGNGIVLDLGALLVAGSDVGRKYVRMTVSESLRDPRIGALYTSAFEGQEAAARELFQRGIDRGELRPDFRMDLAVNWLVGLVILYSIIERQIPSPDEAESLVAFMLEGIGARGEG